MSKEKGLKKLFHPFDHRLSEKVEEIEQKLEHTKLRGAHIKAVHLKHKVGKFSNLFNTNHRHDEDHEKATDAKRSKIAESHRFNSFAPERDGNLVKWYVDGRDYFWAVAEALEKAQETIYIADWWLSPELFLKRPPYYNQQFRLDQILKRRAQAGVKIYISVYKEVSMGMPAVRPATHSPYRFLLLSPATVSIPKRPSWVLSKRVNLVTGTSR
jgi:phospholipase D1/2